MPRRASLPEGKSLFFRQTVPAGDGSSENQDSEGRPESSGETYTRQSAIFLEERQIDWLEDKCREARRRGGRAIRKATIIRALLDVAMESPIDLTALRREEDLVERIRRGLRGG
ncbi:MAG: hypothetical protein IRY83_15945 [Chloroflexi bacterium]|nr:hypothetical protein [Chloroflexota bacterium]HLG51254.1 hypothetical protein [Chloroflexota bacterium]